jgi:hypothetical protein
LILAIWNGIEASTAVVGNIKHAAGPGICELEGTAYFCSVK